VAKCKEEAAALVVAVVEQKPPTGFGGAHVLSPRPGMGELLDAAAEARNVAAMEPCVRTSQASVQARGAALHRLAEDLKEWTAKGEYSTPEELQKKFTGAYRQLPAVEQARPRAD
jgi:hypothetical protein